MYQELDYSGFIFSGKVVESIISDKEEFPGFSYIQITFEVMKSWKGATEKEAVVLTYSGGSAACAFPFYLDEEYLVYAHFREGIEYPITSICHRTREWDRARDDLVILDSKWNSPLQDPVTSGAEISLWETVEPALFDENARTVRIAADLSAVGGPASVPLTEIEGGIFLLDQTVTATVPNGVKRIAIQVDQETEEESYSFELARKITVFPGTDLVIYEDAPADEWELLADHRVALTLREDEPVFQGQFALGVDVDYFNLNFIPRSPVDLTGYATLHFAFHPGDAVGREKEIFDVKVNDERVRLLGEEQTSVGVDLNTRQWQVVDIPLATFAQREVRAILFLGNLRGAFYLDDVLLKREVLPISTAVEVKPTSSPERATWGWAFPNPFNTSVTIPYHLDHPGLVQLSIYYLLGERVKTLKENIQQTGTYSLVWDGRDDRGHDLASGVYLYRLQTGRQVGTRKFLLLK